MGGGGGGGGSGAAVHYKVKNKQKHYKGGVERNINKNRCTES